MKQNNIIIWEKWKDPFGFDDKEDLGVDDADSSSYDNGADEAREIKQVKKIKCQIIATPFGVIPVNENTASSEIFNFWTGHTNFALTQDIASIIEEINGVETLNIFTKYRFRIAIGKAFKDSVVMRKINNSVYSYLLKNNVTNE